MSDLPDITVRFTNELKDHLQAQRLLYRESFGAKLDKIVALLLIGCGIYGVWSVGVYWWTVIWFPLAFAEWFNLLSPSRLQAYVWFKRNPKFREEYRLTFSPEEIFYKTASIDSTLQWTHYQRAVEDTSVFLLMYGRGLYTVVPKRAFAAPGDINAFRALLKTKIPNYRVGHRSSTYPRE